MHPGRSPPSAGQQPDGERGNGKGRRPLRRGAKTEKRTRDHPPFPEGEEEAERKERGGNQVESKLPEERVQGPRGDECRKPGARAGPKRPDGRDSEELERDHDERVRHTRGSAAEKSVERKEEHGRRGILRVWVMAVEKGVSPDAIEHRRVDALHVQAQIERDPGDLESRSQREQWQETEPILAAPCDEEGSAGGERRYQNPSCRSLFYGRELGK
jgi:hypothetical protein